MASSEKDHDDGNKKRKVSYLAAMFENMTNDAQRSYRAVSTRDNSDILKVHFPLITIINSTIVTIT